MAPVFALLAAGCVAPQSGPPTVPAATPLAIAAPRPATRSFRVTGEPVQGGLIHGQVALGTSALTIDGKPVELAADGSFILGFDRDASPAALLVEQGVGGAVAHPLAVAPRAWRIERVDAPYRAGKSDAEFDALRPAELAAIAAARAVRTDAEGWRQPLRWPATGRQSGWFGAQRVYQGRPGSYHSGADVAVPTGTPVVAPADGVVILAADHPFTLEGNLLMLDHGLGLSSALLHLSRIDVRVGDHVRQGQPIALSGATGRATGPHLHWGLQWRGAKLDPLLVAGAVALMDVPVR
jgi:murein DD-endopeptidase MepM/ murein hydrolase activator NlpD